MCVHLSLQVLHQGLLLPYHLLLGSHYVQLVLESRLARVKLCKKVPATHVSSCLFLFVVDSKRVYLSLGLLGIQSGSINF